MFARWFDAVNITVIALGALVIVAAQIQVALPGEFDKKRSESHMFFFDFSKYYVCGKLAGSADRDRVYEPAVQARYLTEFGGADPNKPVEYIQYPPIDFPLMMPLAALPMSQAFNLFYGGGLLLALIGTWLVARPSKNYFANRLSFVCLWLAVIASVPLFRAYSLGQTSLFLLGLTALYFYGFLSKSDKLAGAALALTAIKPQYSVYLAIPALATLRWPIIVSAFVVELLLLALAAATVGVKNIVDFPSVVLHADQASAYGGVFADQMVNLRAIFCLFNNEQAMKLSSLAAIVALLGLAWLWHRYKNSGVNNRLIALTICLCVTTSPHTHLYDCLLMAVAVILTGASSLSAALATRYAARFKAVVENENDGEIKTEHKLFWPQRILDVLMIVYAPLSWLLFFSPLGKEQLHEAALTLPFAFINIIICVLHGICLRHELSTKAPSS